MTIEKAYRILTHYWNEFGDVPVYFFALDDEVSLEMPAERWERAKWAYGLELWLEEFLQFTRNDDPSDEVLVYTGDDHINPVLDICHRISQPGIIIIYDDMIDYWEDDDE